MKISFDPFDPEELNFAMKLLPVLAGLQPATPQTEAARLRERMETAMSGAPPPPPPPSPPSSSSPETEQTTEDVELDANGDPWDPEIHASSKAKTQKGTWRKRRGGKKKPPPQVAQQQNAPQQQELATVPPPPPPPPGGAANGPTWDDVMAAVSTARTERGVEWEECRATLEMRGIDATNLYSLPDRWRDAIGIVSELGA